MIAVVGASLNVMDTGSDAARRVAFAEAAKRREAEAAQMLVDDFVTQAQAKGLPAAPLRAQLTGGGTARTDKAGWCINAAGTLAVGTDGAWYRLVVQGGLAERLRGVRLVPSPPALTVLAGGRDGESGDLRDFLARRLAEG